MKSEDAEICADAITAPAVRRSPRAFEPLARALQDEQPLCRRMALDALANMHDPRTGEKMRALFDDADPEVALHAAEVLNDDDAQQAITLRLLPLLRSGDPQKVLLAARPLINALAHIATLLKM